MGTAFQKKKKKFQHSRRKETWNRHKGGAKITLVLIYGCQKADFTEVERNTALCECECVCLPVCHRRRGSGRAEEGHTTGVKVSPSVLHLSDQSWK